MRPHLRLGGWRRIAARRGRALIVLELGDVWAFEASDQQCFVHSARGRFDVDFSLRELEACLGASFMRVHPRWLANLSLTLEFRNEHGNYGVTVGRAARPELDGRLEIPVASDCAGRVRARLLAGTVGCRMTSHSHR